MNKNNNFIYHFAIFLFSSIGIFLTYRMHMLNSLELDCGSGGCSNVFNSFHLFGISNIYIGMVHYTTLSALSFISLYSSDKINKWNISIRNTLIIVGFLYSIFLMLYLILGEIGFCELCFYSACISTILFFSVIKSGFKNTPDLVHCWIKNKGFLDIDPDIKLVITCYEHCLTWFNKTLIR